MSVLLQAHRLLIGAALVLAAVLIAWGIFHGLMRHEATGWLVFGLGLGSLPGGALYFRKLFRNPPIR